MFRFFTRRLAFMAVTLFIVSIVIFSVTELLPGDVAVMILGSEATDDTLAALRTQLGLDRPAPARYLDWLSGAARGDFGESLRMRTEVGPLVLERLKNSLALAGIALAIGVPLALGLGIIAGLRKDRPADKVITVTTLLGISVPEFVIGSVLIMVFASIWPVLPATSMIDPSGNPLENVKYLILPAVTLVFVTLAHTARMTRSSVIRVMRTDYVRTATLKGMPRGRIILRHVLPNALLPSITVIALNVGWMIGGLIVVETVFAYPGLGQLMIFAVTNRDVPLVQAVALLVALIYALANLGADLLYAVLNPRIRYS
ncbi:MAG: ABC transporter permease [Chloroflexota bacterium]|nr:ABC transporter permease [Chloroflexota bacterium]